MKKIAIALVLVLVLAVVLLVGLGRSGFTLFGKTLFAWNEDVAELERLTRGFLTDLQFKDFDKAALYHTFVDKGKANIPKLIERLFQVKPEFLNIRDFEVVRVEMDPDGKRAKAFFRSTLEILNTAKDDKPNKEKEVEGILYWHKLPGTEARDPKVASTTPPTPEELADTWFMKLESSLHQ
jgi:hypothetical protein